MPGRAGLDTSAVVKAAASLLDERGGKEITLSELATRLGVRTPSLYNHVAGQEELRRRLALLGLAQLGERITQAAIGKAEDEALISIADAYRAFAREHPGLYAASVRAAAPGDVELAAAGDRVIQVLRVVLEPYRLSETDVIHALRGLRSLVHGFVSLELAGGFGIPVDVDQSFHRLVEVFLQGLRVKIDACAPSTSSPTALL